MKKNDILKKLSSGKGFYVTAAMSLVLMAIAVFAVYRTSTGMIQDILTTTPEESRTEQVRRNETDETDPRYTTQPTTAPTTTTQVETTKEKYETSVRWENTEENSTTEKTTQAVISNASYAFPLSGGIQREHSSSAPVYDETMDDWRVHRGIDFSGDTGSEVKSVGNGKVIKVISDTSWGFVVEIDHGDFVGRYCGLEQGTTVKANETVEKGQTIGKLASIPCESKQEPHLHFEAVKEEKIVDPIAAMGLAEE